MRLEYNVRNVQHSGEIRQKILWTQECNDFYNRPDKMVSFVIDFILLYAEERLDLITAAYLGSNHLLLLIADLLQDINTSIFINTDVF